MVCTANCYQSKSLFFYTDRQTDRQTERERDREIKRGRQIEGERD